MSAKRASRSASAATYVLDEQVGFLLRQINQRHGALFADAMGHELTPTQWAALAKLAEMGVCSQNQLGRFTAMDVATIKGVVDRLIRDGHAETHPDPEDGRRFRVALTDQGRETYERLVPVAFKISAATLDALLPKERLEFLRLLKKLR